MMTIFWLSQLLAKSRKSDSSMAVSWRKGLLDLVTFEEGLVISIRNHENFGVFWQQLLVHIF